MPLLVFVSALALLALRPRNEDELGLQAKCDIGARRQGEPHSFRHRLDAARMLPSLFGQIANVDHHLEECFLTRP